MELGVQKSLVVGVFFAYLFEGIRSILSFGYILGKVPAISVCEQQSVYQIPHLDRLA